MLFAATIFAATILAGNGEVLPSAKGMQAGYQIPTSTTTCTTPEGSGTCISVSQCTNDQHSVPGYCPGSSDIQCCVDGPAAEGVLGLDVCDAVSSSTASCFTSTYSFIVPRGYHSTGTVDTAVCNTIKTAYNAGFKVRDAYMFPCPTCSKSAATQMDEVVKYMNANCKTEWSGRIWLDIEGSQYWKGSSSANQAWYQQLVDACKSQTKCGVYSSASQWSALFGSTTYKYGYDLPLWYAHYDNSPSFSDFSAFGGWSTPHAKQYMGDITTCGMDTDKNYAVSF